MLSARFRFLLATIIIIFAHISAHAQAQTCEDECEYDSIYDVTPQPQQQPHKNLMPSDRWPVLALNWVLLEASDGLLYLIPQH